MYLFTVIESEVFQILTYIRQERPNEQYRNTVKEGVYINAKFAKNLLYSYKKHLTIKSLCIFYKPSTEYR